jgi:hypothetical protein
MVKRIFPVLERILYLVQRTPEKAKGTPETMRNVFRAVEYRCVFIKIGNLVVKW